MAPSFNPTLLEINRSTNRNIVHNELHQLSTLSRPNIKIQNLLKKIVREQYDLRVKEHSENPNDNKKKAKELDIEIDNLIDTLQKLTYEPAIKGLEQRIADLEEKKLLLDFDSCESVNSFPVFEVTYNTVADYVQSGLRETYTKKRLQYPVFPKCISYT